MPDALGDQKKVSHPLELESRRAVNNQVRAYKLILGLLQDLRVLLASELSLQSFVNIQYASDS